MDFAKYYDIIIEKVVTWSEDFVSMLPNFILALLALLLFIVIAKIVSKVFKRVMNRVLNNHELIALLSKIIYIVVITVGAFVALSVLNLEKTVTSLLAGAGIIGLALGFAFQDIATNFISGFLMAARRPFEVGDVIKSGDYTGVVKTLNIRTTVITSFQGQEIIIPNKDLFQNVLINDSTNKERRIDLGVGVSYGEDLERVREITLEAVKNVPFRKTDKEISFVYEAFGDSSINFIIMIWVKFDNQLDYLKAQSEAIIAIKKAYDQHDIMIPFPIRTLDFGIKGGEKLNTMLESKGKQE
jgi:small-conductance mechanosensitive channel